MIAVVFRVVGFGFAFVVLANALLQADEQQAADGLLKYESKEGRFSVRLPAKPKYNKTTVGDAKETQHQFQVAGEQGVYLISYQDNPNLEGSERDELQLALERGRDGLQKGFQGELLASEDVLLDDAHPGIGFRLTIPQARGEARCRFYLVDTRLYQILAIGVPEFAASEETTRVIDSFELLP